MWFIIIIKLNNCPLNKLYLLIYFNHIKKNRFNKLSKIYAKCIQVNKKYMVLNKFKKVKLQ
jgi:hypothetical protein